jgi:hypothetical protein
VAGTRIWRRGTTDAVDRLAAAQAAAAQVAEAPAPGTDAPLPPPVARYLALALGTDPYGAAPRRARTARVRWTGEFQMRPGGGWVPFTADQRFTDGPPGFVWDAEMRAFPLVPVRVRDAYVGGAASMLARVGGLFAVVDQRGSAALASSALARWLGEAAWPAHRLSPGRRRDVGGDRRPIRPSDGGRWRRARDGGLHFAPTGEITGMTTSRYRDVDGTPVLTPFEGRYGALVDVGGGVRVPGEAEVAWLLPEGRYAYWRGRPARVEYTVGDASDAPAARR